MTHTETTKNHRAAVRPVRSPELLMPAGGTAQFIAAVENGADAVYVGGSDYNARAGAHNFDREELREAVDYAHKRGVQVHVTMNTLLRQEELEGALEYAAFLYELGIDALIVQDYGLAAVIREAMPDFPLHMSTQATAQDLRTVEAAAELGYQRVVLSRELSLEEIRSICGASDMEIEVFVHGAICICYSGQCQLSRFIGGRSGNRGACAQPCRLPYRTLGEDGKPERQPRCPLSPKDLDYLDHLGELIDAGVCSFKIEGRMKSPEYVAVVTRIYRKYIDRYMEEGRYTVEDLDREALEQIFSRGGFTDAYLRGEPDRRMMSGDIPKHQGIRIGKVVKRVGNSTLVDVKLYDHLAIGDGVEIQGKKLVGNVVTYYKELKGGLTRIGDLKGPVSHGDPLFRISSGDQLEEARRSFRGLTYREGKYQRKRGIVISLRLSPEGMFQAEAEPAREKRSAHPLPAVRVSATAGPFDPVSEGVRGTSKERIREAMGKTGGTPFRCDEVRFGTGFEGEHAPVSIRTASLNEVRRRLLASLEEALIIRRSPAAAPGGPAGMNSGCAGSEAGSFSRLISRTISGAAAGGNSLHRVEFWFYDLETALTFRIPREVRDAGLMVRGLVPAAGLERLRQESGVRDYCELVARTEFDELVPYVTNVTRGRESAFLETHFEDICEAAGETGISCGQLGWLRSFARAGVRVYGDFGLNVYNRKSAEVIRSMGAEWSAPSLEAMDRVNGAWPLMTTAYRPAGTYLISPKKDRLRIRRAKDRSETILLPAEGNMNLDFSAAVRRAKAETAAYSPVVRFYYV
ncbi:peptidase U32 family protein [Eubacterium pyruvativorans]|uniref:peptidase U32 family protein n=1 Tax=Eubacterium pyruvativorans TaxID=155865 RepID=UPI003F8B9C53